MTRGSRLQPNAERRSERSRRAILRAARDLLYRDGFRALTIEGIAARAGVGKATIYRWWPSKAAVAMEALIEDAVPQLPHPDTGSVADDLRSQIARVIEFFNTTKAGRALLAVIAESQHDAALAKALAEQLIAERRASAGEVFRRGIERGELRPDLDVGIAIDSLYGAIYYRLLVSHERVEPDYGDRLVDQLYPGWARTRPARSRRRSQAAAAS
jgi:AcrR family transcriptional regulator